MTRGIDLLGAGRLRVHLLNRQRRLSIDLHALRGAVDHAAEAFDDEGLLPRPMVVSLVLLSDRGIRARNRRFAGLDEPTDVLSFPSGDILEDHRPGVPEDPAEAGDILVSVETASRQVGAKERNGHPRTRDLPEEIVLLFVHGMLHILGYDHGEAEEAALMIEAERRIMTTWRRP